MKAKRIGIILTAALLCFGCSGEGVNLDQIYSADQEYPAQPYWGGHCEIKKTDDGYYFWNSSRQLCFWDPKAKQGTIVCGKSNCDHKGTYCNAWFGDYGDELQYGFGGMDLEIYNDHIYKLGTEKGEVMDFYVYQVSMDGSERKKLFYLYSVEPSPMGGFTWTYDFIMIDGYYYGILRDQEQPYGLTKIRLDGEKTLIYDMSGKSFPDIARLQGAGDYLYFTAQWEESDGQTCYTLMRYNIKTDEIETVLEDFMGSEYCVIDENHIFYYDISNSCYMADLQSGVTECVVENTNEIIQASFDGDHIYLVDMDADTGDEEICVYDTDGTAKDVIRIPPSASVLFGDEEYLFLESDAEPGTGQEARQDDGQEYRTEYMWILDKSQIGSQKKDWMKMELGQWLNS